jgi:hypothetical protein
MIISRIQWFTNPRTRNTAGRLPRPAAPEAPAQRSASGIAGTIIAAKRSPFGSTGKETCTTTLEEVSQGPGSEPNAKLTWKATFEALMTREPQGDETFSMVGWLKKIQKYADYFTASPTLFCAYQTYFHAALNSHALDNRPRSRAHGDCPK